MKSILTEGLIKSLVSLFIKMATAGLTYLMFVVLSRAMSPTEYGLFAFGFALATVLSIGAGLGQQVAILRFWPEDMGRNDLDGARTAMRAGWMLTVIAGLAISGALAVLALLGSQATDGGFAHVLAATLLILPMALAEYASSTLRAQGSVWIALTPRDIVWRSAVPVIVFILFYLGLPVSGVFALTLAAGLLALALVVQAAVAGRAGFVQTIGFKGLAGYWRQRGRASRWFTTSTVLDSAALNVDIILVGLFIAPASAGLYFNAFRTAGLMTLFMYAITLVIAPMVARHYHAGDLYKAQAVTTLCAWAGFIFSIGVFIVYILFGDLILSLFGESYAEGQIILILLSFGLLIDAATGPTRIVMMMTGHEKPYVAIFGTVMLIGFLFQLAIIPTFGIVAAAAVNMLSRIVAQSAIAVWAGRKIGLDTTLTGLVALIRPRRTPAAA